MSRCSAKSKNAALTGPPLTGNSTSNVSSTCCADCCGVPSAACGCLAGLVKNHAGQQRASPPQAQRNADLGNHRRIPPRLPSHELPPERTIVPRTVKLHVHSTGRAGKAQSVAARIREERLIVYVWVGLTMVGGPLILHAGFPEEIEIGHLYFTPFLNVFMHLC